MSTDPKFEIGNSTAGSGIPVDVTLTWQTSIGEDEVRYLHLTKSEWDAVKWVLQGTIRGVNVNSMRYEDPRNKRKEGGE